MNDPITLIAIDQLHESPFNPRKTFGNAKLLELAADIKTQGILSPLLVRARMVNPTAPNPDDMFDGYELVFGHRRLRAAVMAGQAVVPCMVRAMTDAEVKRAQISENLSREDVHPIEEAEGFDALMRDHGVTADQLAEQIGKSRSYIYGRLTLLKAAPDVRQACLDGKFGSEVALLLSRLRTERLQKKALGYIEGKYLQLGDGGQKSFREIRELLREKFTLSLNSKGCMFDTADSLLLPDAGACTSCPKRSGNAPEFEDIATEHHNAWRQPTPGMPDLCTDPDCYDAKKTAHLRLAVAALEAKGKTVIDGAKARQAVDANGNIKGAYVALADVKAQLKKLPKAAKGEAPKVESVLIQDPRTGKAIEAVKVSDLQAAGLHTEHKQAKVVDWKEREHEKRKMREQAFAEAQAETDARMALLIEVRTVAAAQPRSAFDLAMVAHAALAGINFSDHNLMARLWGAESFEELGERLNTMDMPDQTALLIDCALINGVQARWHDSSLQPNQLLQAAKHYGVDPQAVRAQHAKAKAEAKAAAPKEPAEESAEPPKGKKPVQYRCKMTHQTWSGKGLMPKWLKVALENGKKLSDFAVGDAAKRLQESRALCSQASDEPAGDANTERDPNTGDMFDAEDAAA